MKFYDQAAYAALDHRCVTLMGMSGVGKSHLSNILRRTGGWYHYGVDYRLGTAYLREHIDEDLRNRVATNSVFSNLLRKDAVTIRAKISMENLEAMSSYLGTPGDPLQGGMEITEFLRRQRVHERAELAAMDDLQDFTRRAYEVLGCCDVVCDTSGSLCGIVDPDDPDDPVLTNMAMRSIPILIDSSADDEAKLIDRFLKAPKPLFYSTDFFNECERLFDMPSEGWSSVNPKLFTEWALPRLIDYRAKRYRSIANGWGYSVPSEEIARVGDASDFDALLSDVIASNVSP